MNRITAGAIALVLAILLAGCSTQRFAAQCRWVGDDGLVGYRGCTTGKPGEYIVGLGANTDVNIINELYGIFGIRSIKQLREPPLYYSLLGQKKMVEPTPIFLLTITNDPGPQRMFDIGYDYGQLFGRAWVYVTPNYNH